MNAGWIPVKTILNIADWERSHGINEDWPKVRSYYEISNPIFLKPAPISRNPVGLLNKKVYKYEACGVVVNANP